jgi:hypothetical protein
MPWAVTMSVPAATAARASATEPTCQLTSAPASCASRTGVALGVLQKKSTTRTRSVAAGIPLRVDVVGEEVDGQGHGGVGGHRVDPGLEVRDRDSGQNGDRARPAGPPARLTAAASAGVETAPIGACWIGVVQPMSSVNAVVIRATAPVPVEYHPGQPPHRPDTATRRASGGAGPVRAQPSRDPRCPGSVVNKLRSTAVTTTAPSCCAPACRAQYDG